MTTEEAIEIAQNVIRKLEDESGKISEDLKQDIYQVALESRSCEGFDELSLMMTVMSWNQMRPLFARNDDTAMYRPHEEIPSGIMLHSLSRLSKEHIVIMIKE